MSNEPKEFPLNICTGESPTQPLIYSILDWGLLEVKGEDAAKFIQGQATCDVRKIAEVGHMPGAFCSPKGRVLATFVLFAVGESIYLRMPRDLIPKIKATLQKYAAFFKVQLEDASHFVGLGIQAEHLGESQSVPECLYAIENARFSEVWGTAEQINAIQSALSDRFEAADPDWWRARLIHENAAQIFAGTSEQFLAHQLSLDLGGAISFRKGCYTGQEIIARTQYRGKSKKRLAAILVDKGQVFEPGTEVLSMDSKPLGHVLMSVHQGDRALIQAVLPEDITESGSIVLNATPVGYQTLAKTTAERPDSP